MDQLHKLNGRHLLDALRLIDPRALADEPALAKSKAFEHRYVSAYHSTQVYAEEFLRLSKEAFIKLKSSEPGEVEAHQPITLPWTSNPPRIRSALWRGRQHADALGIPYTFFLTFAFIDLVDKAIWQQAPAVNQVYTDKALELISERWGELERETRTSDLPANYHARNFRGDPPQIEWLNLLIARWKKLGAGRREHGLHWAIGRSITEKQAREAFGDQEIDKLKSRGGFEALGPANNLPPYRPSCLGLRPTVFGRAPECAACPVASACVRLSDAAYAQVCAATKGLHPKTAHERALNRARVKRCRDKKKGLLVPVVPRGPNRSRQHRVEALRNKINNWAGV